MNIDSNQLNKKVVIIMALTPLDTINGIFSLIFIVLSTIVGIKVALKYFETKRTTPLWIGIAWIIIPSPWYGSAASFIYALITGTGLPLQIYLLIGNVVLVFFMVFLIAGFTDHYLQNYKKLLVILFLLNGIIFEIILNYYIIFDPNAIGELHGAIDIEYKGIWRVYLISQILLILIIGSLIAISSIRSDNSGIKMRGVFLLLAFISFTIGAIMDAALELTIITLTIARIILISSAIEFDFGFILPK